MSTTVKIGIAVVAVIAAAAAWWAIRPLLVDDVVDEDFPAAAADAGSDADGGLPAEAEVPDDMTAEEVESEMAAAAAAPDVEQVEEMPAADPVAVATGPFAGTSRYDGSGTATIYQLDDGSHVLRFEDFTVTNGPDLRVYLAPIGADGSPDVRAAGAIQLGELKGNVGNQNYDVPADADLSQDLAVVIYCEPFSVTFATAPLA